MLQSTLWFHQLKTTTTPRSGQTHKHIDTHTCAHRSQRPPPPPHCSGHMSRQGSIKSLDKYNFTPDPVILISGGLCARLRAFVHVRCVCCWWGMQSKPSQGPTVPEDLKTQTRSVNTWGRMTFFMNYLFHNIETVSFNGSDVTKQKDSALNIVYVFKHDENIKDNKMVS